MESPDHHILTYLSTAAHM
uniref:Uncharacterized protein n=1 Tax=Anguilla anguilla TaxID=7936 RepID=A0A0E9VP98_ANGAN